MLEMFKDTDKLTVGELKEILKNVPKEMIVCTENVQDGINRHNEIVGFENDEADEYLVLKIDNEAKQEVTDLVDNILGLLGNKKNLTNEEIHILAKADRLTD